MRVGVIRFEGLLDCAFGKAAYLGARHRLLDAAAVHLDDLLNDRLLVFRAQRFLGDLRATERQISHESGVSKSYSCLRVISLPLDSFEELRRLKLSRDRDLILAGNRPGLRFVALLSFRAFLEFECIFVPNEASFEHLCLIECDLLLGFQLSALLSIRLHHGANLLSDVVLAACRRAVDSEAVDRARHIKLVLEMAQSGLLGLAKFLCVLLRFHPRFQIVPPRPVVSDLGEVVLLGSSPRLKVLLLRSAELLGYRLKLLHSFLGHLVRQQLHSA